MQSVSIRNVLGKDADKVLAQVLVSVEFNVEWDYHLMAIRRHAELGKSRSLLMTYRLDVIFVWSASGYRLSGTVFFESLPIF